MITFVGRKSKENITNAREDEEVQLCPNLKCTFPNSANSRSCIECNCSLEDDTTWVLAKFVLQCQNCGAYNTKKSQVCCSCGEPIGENKQNENAVDEDTAFFRICPNCNYQNYANATKCIKCGEDLEDIDPICKTTGSSILVNFLNTRTSSMNSIEILPAIYYAFGRSAHLSEDKDLGNRKYVHGVHFVILYKEDSLYIIDCSSNGTFVNGKRLNKGVKHSLFSGDIIGVGSPTVTDADAAFYKISF